MFNSDQTLPLLSWKISGAAPPHPGTEEPGSKASKNQHRAVGDPSHPAGTAPRPPGPPPCSSPHARAHRSPPSTARSHAGQEGFAAGSVMEKRERRGEKSNVGRETRTDLGLGCLRLHPLGSVRPLMASHEPGAVRGVLRPESSGALMCCGLLRAVLRARLPATSLLVVGQCLP